MGSTLQPCQRHSEKFEVSRDQSFDFVGEKTRLYTRPMRGHDIDMACRKLPLKHLDSGQGPVDSVDSICRATHMRFIVDVVSTEKRLATKSSKAGLS